MKRVSRSKSKGGGPEYEGVRAGDRLAGFSLRSSSSTPDEMNDRVSALVGRANCLVRNAAIPCATVSAMPARTCECQLYSILWDSVDLTALVTMVVNRGF